MKKLILLLILAFFAFYENKSDGSLNPPKNLSKEHRIPQELPEEYLVSKQDWKYLCNNGPRLFNQSVVTVPSGVTIQYKYIRDGNGLIKRPIKPVRVLNSS
jgi:hypothetical protein